MGLRVWSMALATAVLATALSASAKEIAVAGAPCKPPVARCPVDDPKCPTIVSDPGAMTEAKTGRKYFLDYACGLKAGDTAIFVLNIHGTGAPPNWHRHYFPMVDVKDKYRLIVATPKATASQWRDAADLDHLKNVVEEVRAAFPGVKMKFWITGHSQGGGYAGTLMCKNAFPLKPIGYVSLSGGRIGAPFGGPGGEPRNESGGRGRAAAGNEPNPLPACDYSLIYTAGNLEFAGQPMPTTSRFADRLGCKPASVRQKDIVDAKAGYVHDSTRTGDPSWGLEPKPGTAQWAKFDKCRDGRLVADFWRLNKGHTEGLEPKVTEEIVKAMASVKR